MATKGRPPEPNNISENILSVYTENEGERNRLKG